MKKIKKFFGKYYIELIFAASFLLLIMRALFSFCWSDETLYYSTAYRFIQGDAPFLDEWYPTQLISILIAPIMKLYIVIVGSTSGVILFFRIVYVVFSTFCAYLCYGIIKKYVANFWAMSVGLLMLFYVHLNIATFSYYAVSVLCATVSMILLYDFVRENISCDTKKKKPKSVLNLIFSGVFYAILVLSAPTMAVVYVIVVFAMAITYFVMKIKSHMTTLNNFESCYIMDTPRIFAWSFVGIGVVAVIFLIFLFSRVNVSEIIEALPFILSDEEHTEASLYVTAKLCFTNLTGVFGIFGWLSFAIIAISVIYWIVSLILEVPDKLDKIVHQATVILDVVAFIGMFTKCIGHTGYVQAALALFALPIFFINEKRDYIMFFTVFLMGIFMAYSYTYTSSGAAIYTETIGLAVSAFAGTVMIGEYTLGRGKIRNILFSAVMVLTLILTMYLRLVNIYRDDEPANLTAKIEKGPAKGLYTSEAHFEDYEKVMDTFEIIESLKMDDSDDQNLLITKLMPFGYMCTDMRCAAPSSWRSALNSEWLVSYYKIHPEKLPDVVLKLDDHFGGYETCGDVEADYMTNTNEMGEYMRLYLEDGDFDQMKVPCGTLYIKTN